MAHYRQGSVSFQAPARWADKSTVGFVPSPPGPDRGSRVPGIEIWRESVRPNETLLTHTARMVVKLSTEQPGFKLLESGEVAVGGRRASLTRLQFESQGDVVEQTRVAIDPASDPDGFIVIFMAAYRAGEADVTRASLFGVLKTVRSEATAPASSSSATLPVGQPSSSPAPWLPDALPPLVPMPGQRPRR